MKLRPIASNMTELESGDKTVLFSYQTPVACHIAGEGYYRTSKRWSVTTSKHIGKWLAANRAQGPVAERDQAFFDALIGA
jgi:hypothetical protein